MRGGAEGIRTPDPHTARTRHSAVTGHQPCSARTSGLLGVAWCPQRWLLGWLLAFAAWLTSRASRRAGFAPAGPRLGGEGGAPHQPNDLRHPGVVWLPVVRGGRYRVSRASRSAQVQDWKSWPPEAPAGTRA